MADMIPQGVQRREKNHEGYERGDASIRAIFVSVVVIFSTILTVMLVIVGMSYALLKREKSQDVALTAVYERPIPPEPRLLPSRASGDGDAYDKYPWELGAQEREAQLKAATTPYFIDKERGQVSIPTAQAIDLVAAQGLPARQPKGDNQPNIGEDIAGNHGVSSPQTADSDLDGSMVPDTTGGRAMDDAHIEPPTLGTTTQIAPKDESQMASMRVETKENLGATAAPMMP